MKGFRSVAILIVLHSFNIISAQGIEKNGLTQPITTAVPFLRITPDARSSGMADVGVSTRPDAASIYHNASKLAFAESDYAVKISFAPWLRQITNDIYLANLAGYKKINENHVFGASFRYFTLGQINFTDEFGASTGSGKPNEFTLEGAYTFKLNEFFSIGAGARFIYSNLSSGLRDNTDQSAGTAFAVDFSTFYSRPLELNGLQSSRINIGTNFSNIGSKMQYLKIGEADYIPANLAIGTTFNAEFDDANAASFSLEFNKLLVPTPVFYDSSGVSRLDPNYRKQSSFAGVLSSFGDHPDGISGEIKEVIVQVGAEYSYMKTFFVRAGYFFETESSGGRNYATAGVGLKYKKMMMDFAYLIPLKQQRSPLDNQMKLSLTFELGAEESQFNSNGW